MTCKEFERILLDSQHRMTASDRLLRASRAAMIQEHVNNCRACATRMGEITSLEEALGQLRVSTRHIGAPLSVEKKLLQAFHDIAARRRPAIRVAPSWKLARLAVATMALVVTGILLYPKLSPDSALTEKTDGSSSERVISGRSLPVISSAAVPEIDQTRKPSPGNPQTRLKRRSAQSYAEIAEAGGVPRPVQANEALSLNGGGSVVRVTLPVSSLVAVGIPVRPDLSENRVTADVWMDPFGAVVRVRLVP